MNKFVITSDENESYCCVAKCTACKKTFTTTIVRDYVNGQSVESIEFDYCPMCGVKFEGEIPNSRRIIDENGCRYIKGKPHCGNPERYSTMENRRNFLKHVKFHHEKFLFAMDKFRNDVAEYLDKVLEDTDGYTRYMKPKCHATIGTRKEDWAKHSLTYYL